MNGTRLAIGARPVVVFNEQDKQHRELLFSFLESGTWSKSPTRFVHKDGSSEQLPAMLGDLAKYYASREFRSKSL